MHGGVGSQPKEASRLEPEARQTPDHESRTIGTTPQCDNVGEGSRLPYPLKRRRRAIRPKGEIGSPFSFSGIESRENLKKEEKTMGKALSPEERAKLDAEMEAAADEAWKKLDVKAANASGDGVKAVANWVKANYLKTGYAKLMRRLLTIAD
jgi:hypothetical protein